MAKNIKIDNLELLAKIIHSKRMALHLSANDLAEQSNVNVRTIEDIEALRSSNNFREQTLIDLAKVLNIDLLNLSDENKNTNLDINLKFSRFLDASIDLEKKIMEQLDEGHSLSLKWLGVTMAYGGPYLEQLINKIIRRSTQIDLSIEIIMLDPSIEQLKSIQNPWLKSHQKSISLLKKLFALINNNFSKSKSGLYLYSDIPDYHGFMLNDKYLYWSQCTYETGSWVVSENPYHFIDVLTESNRINEKNRFMSWYEYCKQVDCLS